MTSTSARIRSLNDTFRQAGPISGHWMLTAGIRSEGSDFVSLALQAVIGFDAFNPDNDPYGEHDFGSLNLGGQLIFWKIDCYDRELRYGSPDPADPAVTRRVMTIMLALEY